MLLPSDLENIDSNEIMACIIPPDIDIEMGIPDSIKGKILNLENLKKNYPFHKCSLFKLENYIKFKFETFPPAGLPETFCDIS